jgi:hypothetical protein
MPNLRKLGDALDRAERACSAAWISDDAGGIVPDTMPCAAYYPLCDALMAAEVAYVRAVNARDRAARERARNQRTTGDAFKLRIAESEAINHRDVLYELGPDFSTERERIDAAAAASQAEDLYAIAERQFQEVQRQARNGIRPRPRGARLVTDGYVTTGYKMIDGAPVPMLRKVQ